MLKKITIATLGLLIFAFQTPVFAYNPCISATTIVGLTNNNSTSLLADLSAMCDKQDAINASIVTLNSNFNTLNGNVTSLTTNILSLINTNQNLTAHISNISAYIGSGALNETIRNVTTEQLRAYSDVRSLVANMSALATSVQQISNLTSYTTYTDERFQSIGNSYATKLEVQLLGQNITSQLNDLRAQQVAQPEEFQLDVVSIAAILVVIAVLTFGGWKIFGKKGGSRRGDGTPNITDKSPSTTYLPEHPYDGDSGRVGTRGQTETNEDARAETYVKRKKSEVERDERTKKALKKIKKD